MRRRFLATRILLAVALIGGATGVVLAPASPAAAACHDVGCNGLDPNVNCAASATPRDWPVSSDMTLQLRYSAGCSAFWGRAMQDCYGLPPLYIRVERQIYGYYGYYTSSRYFSGQVPCGGNPGWTPMVADYGNDRARSCIGRSYDGRDPSAMPEDWWSACVAWY